MMGLIIKDADQEMICHLSDLLHLFNHRNKNQHRRSVWWRHFAVFRKQLDDLASDVKSLREIPTTHLAKTKKKAVDEQTTERIKQQTAFWQDTMVPKWQRAFSQVTADGRFSIPGLFLLAVLADVCRIMGITVAFEELAKSKVEKLLQDFAQESRLELGSRKISPIKDSDAEDVGEKLERDAPPSSDVETREFSSKELEKAAMMPQTAKAPNDSLMAGPKPEKRRKRRKGNAIDDLFRGLG
jgi:ribonuclease MRP protein subunit RMP1